MATSAQTAAGVTVPDTKLAREATELIRDRTTDLVYHHSRRVYFWGSAPNTAERSTGRCYSECRSIAPKSSLRGSRHKNSLQIPTTKRVRDGVFLKQLRA